VLRALLGQLIHTLPTADLNDTVYVDTLINTLDRGWVYRVELYNNAPGNRFLIGDPGIASSLFLTALPGDRKMRFVLTSNVPWINTSYDFYRFNGMTWVLVGSTNQLNFTDRESCQRHGVLLLCSITGRLPGCMARLKT
jgi:hypothetical protein